MSSILGAIAAFPTAVEDGSRLSDEISTMKDKLPYALFHGEDGIDIDESSVIEDIVNSAKEHLLARLLSEGLDQ